MFFLTVADFYKSITSWRDKEVSAYTFPKYKEDVAEIFKNMPEMMEYFSTLLGVDFPWDKMANVMAYDYTAGAMENSSAIIYYDRLLCDRQQLIDGNFDWIIAHELFHQWFGDLVTAESWANLTLNESFADYSEYLWTAYKYGKEEADGYRIEATDKYLNSYSYKNNAIVYYYYDHPHDMFDNIRYEKGGAVLHMLRNYVGDQAFFLALSNYLKAHKFGNAEVSDLRKSLENVTGKDLSWFFNQWWFDKGHPILDITHKYDASNKTIELTIHQTQTEKEGPIFRIPTKVAIYANGKVITKTIDITDKISTFYFPTETAPQLVNFDADKVLLCEKTEDLSEAENIFKFYNAPTVKDKLEALTALSYKQKGNIAVQELLYKALQDKSWYVRNKAIDEIEIDKFISKSRLSLALQNIIHTDIKSDVRENALNKYAKIEKEKCAELVERVLQTDSSYKVLASALSILQKYDYAKAYSYAEKWNTTESRAMMKSICSIYKDSIADKMDFFKKAIWLNTSYTFYTNYRSFETYLQNASTTQLENGILFLKDIAKYEESDYNKDAAIQTIRNLKYYFTEKSKKDKLADIKLQIVTKAGNRN